MAATSQDPDRVQQGGHPAPLAEHTSVTFSTFTFRDHAARGKNGKKFTLFLPGVSKDVQANMSA